MRAARPALDRRDRPSDGVWVEVELLGQRDRLAAKAGSRGQDEEAHGLLDKRPPSRRYSPSHRPPGARFTGGCFAHESGRRFWRAWQETWACDQEAEDL